MKKLISVILTLFLSIVLCGCDKKPAADTTAATIPATTAAPDPGCQHEYLDADCVTPKVCTRCGATRGKALGHSYALGFCSRCGSEDASYIPLTDGNWIAYVASDDAQSVERIRVTFPDDQTAILKVDCYANWANIAEDQRDQFDTDALLDYSSHLYYLEQSFDALQMTLTMDGNLITCTISDGDQILATLMLERVAGNQLQVSYLEGELGTALLQIGEILQGEK